jgi:DNA-binding transcriptional LysR family regulator
MEFDQLETFLLVSSLGSMTKAAEQLFLTNASVRKRIKELENELGAPLFKKEGRFIQLTEKGQAYVPFAEKMIAIMNKAEIQLKEPSNETGIVKVAATWNFCTFALISWLAQFRVLYPNIEVDLSTDFSRPIMDRVLNGSIDIGIIRGPVYHKNLQIKPIYWDKVIPIISPNHPWFGRDVVSVEMLNDQPFIVFDRFSSTWEGIEHWLNQHQILINIRMELDQVETCKLMVQKGHGISFVPDFTVEEELAQGLVGTFAIDPPLLHIRQTELIVNRHHDHPRHVKELADFCMTMSASVGRLPHGS